MSPWCNAALTFLLALWVILGSAPAHASPSGALDAWSEGLAASATVPAPFSREPGALDAADPGANTYLRAPSPAGGDTPRETRRVGTAGIAVVAEATDTLARRPRHERLLVERETTALAARAFPDPWELDAAIANRVGAETLQRSPTIRAVAGALRFLALPGTLLFASAMYGAGELSDRPDLSAYGLHTGQAVVVAGATTLAGKLLLGRARPHDSPDDPADFGLGRGIRGDRYQSFPSAHTAAAFAAAALLGSEVSTRDPGTGAWLAPLLYGTAALAGVSRIYHNEHWATDIAAGAVIGTVAGRQTAAHHREE